jgi:acetyl-CoA synthetase
MLPDIHDYNALRAAFRWQVPERCNIGADVCDRWAKAEPERAAILDVFADGRVVSTSYGQLRDRSNRLANALLARGVKRQDRVAILMPQGRDVAVGHIALYKLGAIAVPLAALFGVEALSYRLADSGAVAIICDGQSLKKLRQIETPLPALRLIICADGADGDAPGLEALISDASPDFAPRDTLADEPALMIYTSGTTGSPKGALHGHRVLPGHLPGVQMPHDFLPQPGDRLWTPADWAWAGGLLNVLLPGLHFGVPVVARRFEKFDGEAGLELVERMGVRNIFLPPTALRMLRAVPDIRKTFRLDLRSVGSGGEALGAETFEWGREALGVPINEFYGQTECNLVLASSAAMGVSKAGFIGKAVPGHEVAVIREDGSPCEVEEEGQIAIRRPDPVMFLRYWNNDKATQAKFIGDWMTTGDQGLMDGEGYVRFVGRDDDLITSAGYRIGPSEIEDCLIRHRAVSLAAAVGKPDRLRTEIVKAYVVLKPGFSPSPELAAEIQGFVRTRLSAHEYPREIAFREELPMTTTGKIIRRILRDESALD